MPRTAPHEPTGGFSLASLMMFVTLATVVMGVSTIAPGIGVPLGIALLVVWIRTTMVAERRAARGHSVTRQEKLQLFLASFGATVAMLTVLCIAGCGAFIAACFACVGTWSAAGGDRGSVAGTTLAWTVFGLVILVIVGPVLRLLYRWVRNRWQRDIGDSDS